MMSTATAASLQRTIGTFGLAANMGHTTATDRHERSVAAMQTDQHALSAHRFRTRVYGGTALSSPGESASFRLAPPRSDDAGLGLDYMPIDCVPATTRCTARRRPIAADVPGQSRWHRPASAEPPTTATACTAFPVGLRQRRLCCQRATTIGTLPPLVRARAGSFVDAVLRVRHR